MNTPFLALFATMLLAVACSRQADTQGLELRWQILENTLEPTAQHQAAFTLINTGSDVLEPGWALYFNAIYIAQRPAFDSAAVRIEHLSGDWFRLEPADTTRPLVPGDSVTFRYSSPRFLNANTQFPESPYIVPAGESKGYALPYHIASEIDVEWLVEQYAHTNRRVPGATLLFDQNESVDVLPAASVMPVVPSPVTFRQTGGVLVLESPIELLHDPRFAVETALFADQLREVTRAEVLISHGENAPVQIRHTNDITRPEGYRLTIDGKGILLEAGAPAGAHYGMQTLLALITPDQLASPTEEIRFPEVQIYDYPRFAYRGLFLDIARNFQQKQDIKRLLDVMSFYKFNVLQLHLANDEAWRIEIPGLPELTEVASRRGHTQTHRDHLHPVYGSGPDPEHSPYGSGHLSRTDLIEILRYARARHITVIPEIVAPGHMRAAIMAMHARYDRYMAEGNSEKALEFLLEHPDDASEYISVQRYRNNTMDVCMESSYRFYTHVLDEIIRMYQEAGAPLQTFHVGGDEVPYGVWMGSPACQSLMGQNPDINGRQDLHNHYYTRLNQILAERGLQLAGWEEVGQQRVREGNRTVSRPNTVLLEKNIRLHAWNAVVGWTGTDMAYQLANAGYEVIMSNSSNVYFDLAYDMHPDEPGLHWSGYVNLRSAWQLTPFNHFISNDFDIQGNPVDARAMAAQHEALTDAGRDRIIGLQGQLWTETVKGPDMMFYYLLPKMLGLSERAWSPDPAWAGIQERDRRNAMRDRQWNRFANTVGQIEFDRLDHLFGGYETRIPRPGAVLRGGVLHANVETPGLIIRYTTDGTPPTVDSPEYTGPVRAEGTVTLAAFTSLGRRGGLTRVE
ncbi:MAG: N-acetyl-beta-hexosaminidase HexB [Bacteroidetes bacterium HLUCCA01]|nr:MAG: N-acetyl-beta-hexosaminidase HexB [Bacteroidetes bacterium HLUCCA01]